MANERAGGYPPGYDFKRSRPNSDQVDANKRAKAVDEFSKQPGGLRGQPIEYDDYGIPKIDETEHAPPPPLHNPQQQVHPPQPVHPQPVQPSRPDVKNYRHPVLEKMYQTFGLKSQKKHNLSVKINDTEIVYTMTMIPDEIILWAMEGTQKKIVTHGDQYALSWFSLMQACCAVVAIDDEPVYAVFGVLPNRAEKMQLDVDPLNLPVSLRKRTGEALAGFLLNDTYPIGDKLSDFYATKVANQYKIQSTLDQENSTKARYVCPVENCPENEVLEQKNPAGEEATYFCRSHGNELVKVATAETEGSLPLV